VSNRRLIGGIVALALIVRIAVVLGTPAFRPNTDASNFDQIAVSVARDGHFPTSPFTLHGGPTAFRPPLFPLALAGVYALSGTGSTTTRWEAGRMLEAILGAVAVLLLTLIGIRLFGRVTGLVAGGIAAVYPPLILVGSSLLSESLFIPLVLAATWAALSARGSPHRLRWAVASGVFVGLGELTRSNGIVLVIPLGLLVWDLTPSRSWRAARAPAAMLAAALVTLIPWTARDIAVFHQFVPVTTQAGYGLAGTYNPMAQDRHDYPALWIPPLYDIGLSFRAHPDYNEEQVSGDVLGDAVTYIKDHPFSVVRTTYWSFLRLFNLSGIGFERYAAPFEAYPLALAEISVVAFWLLALLAIGGVFTAAVRRVPRAIWGCPMLIILTVVFFEGSTRYRSPADPFFILLAAPAVVSLAHRYGNRLLASASARVRVRT
jgi:4-amino-4-deoxy-L-arabinose transferase-like glycosyltransferase